MPACLSVYRSTLLKECHRQAKLVLRAQAVQDPHQPEVLTQTTVGIPLGYMCAAAYYSLFKLGMFSFYHMVPHATDPHSLLMNAGQVSRFAAPLAFNFLHVVRLQSGLPDGRVCTWLRHSCSLPAICLALYPSFPRASNVDWCWCTALAAVCKGHMNGTAAEHAQGCNVLLQQASEMSLRLRSGPGALAQYATLQPVLQKTRLAHLFHTPCVQAHCILCLLRCCRPV